MHYCDTALNHSYSVVNDCQGRTVDAGLGADAPCFCLNGSTFAVIVLGFVNINMP